MTTAKRAKIIMSLALVVFASMASAAEPWPWATQAEIEAMPPFGQLACPNGAMGQIYFTGTHYVFVLGARWAGARKNHDGSMHLWFGVFRDGRAIVQRDEPHDAKRHTSPCQDWLGGLAGERT